MENMSRDDVERFLRKRRRQEMEKGQFSTSFSMLSYPQFAMHPGDSNRNLPQFASSNCLAAMAFPEIEFESQINVLDGLTATVN